MQPPEGLLEKVRGLQKLKSVADSRPKTVRKGACQEIVLTGDDVDLTKLPIQRCWPGDPAPFITLPAVITHDPQTGGRNVGMYRMQVIDRHTTFMHWQIHKDGRADALATDGRIEVAVALGLDPITAYSASAPLPKHIDEFMMAGFLRGEPVELVKGVTVGIEVPAHAEIVLEGYIEKDEVGEEGPFGDHTGYYTAAEPFPVFHVTAMTMRNGAIYPSIVVGKPPQEDAWLGEGDRADLPAGRPHDAAGGRRLRPAGRGRVPQHGDRLDQESSSPATPRRSCTRSGGSGCSSLTKCVVVVDADVDVHDYEQVLFYAGANVDPKRDVIVSEGPLDHLDHAPERQFYGGKLGIDATAKWPEEGARPWPEEIEMSAEVKELVTRALGRVRPELVPASAVRRFG